MPVPGANDLREALSRTAADDGDTVRSLASRLRDAIEDAAVPDTVTAAIDSALARFARDTLFAVRSSATAEDLAGASFAGGHDTFLDVYGRDAVVNAALRCWASLYSDRAVSYRRNARFAETDVRMAVVVQQMVPADASGVLFTADPVSGDRRTVTVEAVRGVGAAFVAGRVRADVYRVRGDDLLSCDPAGAGAPVLSEDQAVRLASLGRHLEDALGGPQDIEWCLAGDQLFVVHSRPITTLFPVPPVDDERFHVYLSVGHQQMMTDAMRPLGLSCWQMTTPAPRVEAGNRLFVDVTSRLASPTMRDGVLRIAREHDPLTFDALNTVLNGDRLSAMAGADSSRPAGGVAHWDSNLGEDLADDTDLPTPDRRSSPT